MGNTMVIFRRELKSYFTTPMAYIFIAVFLGLVGLLPFNLDRFFEARQADLWAFFRWHPWLYLFLVPAISMRLWAEERKSGTIELLFTLPVSQVQAVAAKFFAGWVLLLVSLALTFPIVITVSILGEPDMGQIVAGYLGSFLMAGAYLSIGCCMSALTKNQVISFVLSALVCFLLMVAHFPVVLDAFAAGPPWLGEAVNSLSFLSHYESILRGVVEMRDLFFFGSVICAFLYGCAIVLDSKKYQ